jgi:hypothetical protein
MNTPPLEASWRHWMPRASEAFPMRLGDAALAMEK